MLISLKLLNITQKMRKTTFIYFDIFQRMIDTIAKVTHNDLYHLFEGKEINCNISERES